MGGVFGGVLHGMQGNDRLGGRIQNHSPLVRLQGSFRVAYKTSILNNGCHNFIRGSKTSIKITVTNGDEKANSEKRKQTGFDFALIILRKKWRVLHEIITL